MVRLEQDWEQRVMKVKRFELECSRLGNPPPPSLPEFWEQREKTQWLFPLFLQQFIKLRRRFGEAGIWPGPPHPHRQLLFIRKQSAPDESSQALTAFLLRRTSGSSTSFSSPLRFAPVPRTLSRLCLGTSAPFRQPLLLRLQASLCYLAVKRTS